MTELTLIFFTAFLAATLLPFYSEILVVTAFLDKPETWFAIWIVASIGNSLGSAVNWLLGRYLLHYQDRKWFPFKPDQMERAQTWFQKYGVWSLLLAWAPVGGDPLTFIAGTMRVRFWLFFSLTFIGKSARYLFVLYVTKMTMM
ncbi:YqaA family protein [Methylomonas methanica]|uniref:SNARE associated Golgi protein-like protein n=1 Tax=Methylomonas methanica (strain DSM 25384 / MC09) TaxID=857087 RepID=G0A6P6_METMM|nr:YqaA family protein [Methylomonas methanica]AEF99347.1 SNARE associated Golgi protein-like protein [Methylomonas methanica MC09]